MAFGHSHDQVAPPTVFGHHRRHPVLQQAQRLDGRPLGEFSRTAVGVSQQQLDPPGQGLRHDPISQPPSAHGVGLRETVDDHRPLLHARQRGDARGDAAGEGDAGVDLVRDDPGIQPARCRGDMFEVIRWDDPPRRIGRRVEDDDLVRPLRAGSKPPGRRKNRALR